MNDNLGLSAEERSNEGKSSNRALRRDGAIPGVLYGGSDSPIKISILEKDLVKAAESPSFATQILKMNVGSQSVDVVVKELQRHPATSRFLHADFLRVDPDSKITLSVPVRFLNEETCVGVKMHGGQINRLINDIEVICLASSLPEYLEVDVENLDIGDNIFLTEMSLPEGVEILSLTRGDDQDQAVVSVTEARVMEVDEPEVELEEDEESEEGEAPESADSDDSQEEPSEEASEDS